MKVKLLKGEVGTIQVLKDKLVQMSDISEV